MKKPDRKETIFKVSSKEVDLGRGAAADPNWKIYPDKEVLIIIRAKNSLRNNLAIFVIARQCAFASRLKGTSLVVPIKIIITNA